MDNQNETNTETGPSVREALESATSTAADAVPETSSVRDTLRSAFDAHASDAAPDSERPSPKQVAEQITARDAPTKTATTPTTGATTTNSTAKGPAPVAAPQHWPQADKDAYAKAPKEIQDAWLRRDSEIDRGWHAATQEIAPLRDVTARVKPYLDHLGVPAHQAFDNIVQLDYLLRTGTPEEKALIMQKLLEDYGVTLPDNAASDEWEDPAVTALRRNLQAQAQEFQTHTQALQSQVQSVVRDRYLSEITALENEKDASGKVANPHLEIVAADIARIAQAQRAAGHPIPPLKQMYELAVQHNPKVKALVQKQQTEAAARNRKPASPRAPAGSVRATLEQAMQR